MYFLFILSPELDFGWNAVNLTNIETLECHFLVHTD